MAKTILIVDDSTSLRTVVKLALQRAGYDVLEAGDGVEGLSQLDKEGKVNLIVSDVNMPHMDGISFVKQLKQHPRHKFAPVIMLTPRARTRRKSKAVRPVPRPGSSSPSTRRNGWNAVSKLVLP